MTKTGLEELEGLACGIANHARVLLGDEQLAAEMEVADFEEGDHIDAISDYANDILNMIGRPATCPECEENTLAQARGIERLRAMRRRLEGPKAKA